MSHINVELQSMLFQVLNTDGDLSDLGVKGVYDKVVDNAAYPYIRLDKMDAKPFDNHSDTGFSGEVTVKVFDQNDSSLRTKQIQGRIYDLLHDGNVDTTSFEKINFRCKLTNSIIENDSRTHNGTQIFEFIYSRKINP